MQAGFGDRVDAEFRRRRFAEKLQPGGTQPPRDVAVLTLLQAAAQTRTHRQRAAGHTDAFLEQKRQAGHRGVGSELWLAIDRAGHEIELRIEPLDREPRTTMQLDRTHLAAAQQLHQPQRVVTRIFVQPHRDTAAARIAAMICAWLWIDSR